MTATHTTYVERAYLTRSKHRRLDRALSECARLYNAALEEWKTAYDQARVQRTYFDQCGELTAVRAHDDYWRSISLQIGRGVLRRLERARQAFFRRVKAGETPGYPRFRASRRWRTIEVAEPTPAMITNRRGRWVVKVRGLPVLVLKPHRNLPDPSCIKTITITRRPNGVYVSLTYAVSKDALPNTGSAVGLDMGIASRIALSDGGFIKRRA